MDSAETMKGLLTGEISILGIKLSKDHSDCTVTRGTNTKGGGSKKLRRKTKQSLHIRKIEANTPANIKLTEVRIKSILFFF